MPYLHEDALNPKLSLMRVDLKKLHLCETKQDFVRGVLRTLSNIYGKVFMKKILAVKNFSV